MAHPYSANPLYSGTPSYAPQPQYYPSYPSNGLQQQHQMQASPGLGQQPALSQGQQQPFPTYQQQQPSPSINGPRFEQNSQIPPPAPPFPPFPPPINFNPDFFKQFASAGFPPPPLLPNLPPVPLPSPGYPQLHTPVNTSTSSPYPQFHTAGNQGFGSSFHQNEQAQHGVSQYPGSHQGTQVGMEWQRDPQTYAAAAVPQVGDLHHMRPASKGVISLGNEKGWFAKHPTIPTLINVPDQSLPSFGSRSDLDMLFATAQPMQEEHPQIAAIPQDENVDHTPDHDGVDEGGASPYDPTRPATLEDRPSGGFAPTSNASKKSVVKNVERTYDNKSHTELRQLAKGAVLSLVPHKILYADLIKEGINPQILRELYGELGLKIEPDHAKLLPENQVQSDKSSGEAQALSAQQQPALIPDVAPAVSVSSTAAAEAVPLPALVDVRKQQSAPSPSLERKDRIAQLLAAKTGRPSPSPVAQSSTMQEESTVPAFATTSAKANDATAAPSTSQTPPVSQPEAAIPIQSANPNKLKAQAGLVRQKMEQLKREAQARSDANSSRPSQTSSGTTDRNSTADIARPIPQFGSVTPLAASKASSFFGQPSVTSLIPGLFMSSTEVPGLTESAVHSSPFQALSSSIVPAKRPSGLDNASQPPSKKPNVQQTVQDTPAVLPMDNDLDYQSEGEVVEEPTDNAMVLDQETETVPQHEDPNRLADIDQDSLAALPNMPNNGSGSGHLYRAKQSEIESMRRKIAEMERNKLKRARTQLESPASSKPATPAVAGEDRPLTSSPIAQTNDLNGAQRQVPGIRTTAKLTREQLLERAAALKENLKQRGQRQQVLQEGLPDLNAEVKNSETRLDNSRQELVQIRSQIRGVQTELDRLLAQEKELDEEVTRFEQQLEEGREGQKQYSDELRQIKLEKLAEEEAGPAQQPPEVVPPTQSTTTDDSGMMLVSSTEEADHQVPIPQDGHIPADVPFEGTTTTALDEEGDTEMQVEDDESLISESADDPVPEETEAVPAFESESHHEHEEHGDSISGSPISHHVEVAGFDEEDSTDAQLQAAIEDQLGAGEMEISPEPEDYVESHETLPTNLETAHEPAEEAMDLDDDSDGSASMSGSDENDEEYEPAEANTSLPQLEEDYEPAEADTSVPMQQSEDEGEYDPETAPVESATPTTAIDENDSPYDPAAVMGVAESALIPADTEVPINGVSAAASSFAESPVYAETTADQVSAISEVPVNTTDDLETNAQLTEADAMVKPPQGHGGTMEDIFLDGKSTPNVHYVPYKTPLSSFKSYRFHSEFNDTVKTGYRSLTYSNSIDPSRPLCSTELSGQTCTDATCEDQHFSQLGLPDEKILVQMSSASDIKDKATRDEFHAGLKVVIAGLRAHDVKDFEKVADALSKYRREFFADRATAGAENQDQETVAPEAEQDLRS